MKNLLRLFILAACIPLQADEIRFSIPAGSPLKTFAHQQPIYFCREGIKTEYFETQKTVDEKTGNEIEKRVKRIKLESHGKPTIKFPPEFLTYGFATITTEQPLKGEKIYIVIGNHEKHWQSKPLILENDPPYTFELGYTAMDLDHQVLIIPVEEPAKPISPRPSSSSRNRQSHDPAKPPLLQSKQSLQQSLASPQEANTNPLVKKFIKAK